MSTTISVSEDYGLVIMAAAGIAFQILLQGFIHVGAARRKVFDAAYYKQESVKALLEEHKKATGEAQLPKGGYPDCGSGRFTALMPYQSWLLFNNAQRAHINYVEGAATILCLLLLAGLRFAFPSAVLGFAYIVGREFYAWGYSKLGAKGRLVGALIVDFALVALFVMAIMTGWQMANVSKRLGL